MKRVLGVLFAHGHSVQTLTSLTWDQCSLMAECIIGYELDRFDMHMGALAALSGAKWKPSRLRKGRNSKKYGVTPAGQPVVEDAAWRKRAEARDAAILQGMGARGLKIADK